MHGRKLLKHTYGFTEKLYNLRPMHASLYCAHIDGTCLSQWPSYRANNSKEPQHLKLSSISASSPCHNASVSRAHVYHAYTCLLPTPCPAGTAGAAALDSELSTPQAAAAAPPPASGPDSPSATDGGAPAMPPVLKTIEERIAFLEMEVLKQSLAATTLPGTAGLLPDGTIKDSSRMASGAPSSSFRGTAAALNPVGAGAGGLNAAAAAAANRWNADSVLYKRPSPPFGSSSGDLQRPVPDALSITTQLAAAAELGQLDPEVYTIAEALAVRQGFAGLPPEPYPLSPQQQQPRRPSSIWGRSVHHSRPLSANAWGAPGVYDPGYGEPLLTRQELDEEVPYQPTGWAVAGTIVTVYLGVIVTFLALCVGDMPY